MSLLHRGILRPKVIGQSRLNSVNCICPKCQMDISITQIQGTAPIRCEHCSYPFIRRSDLQRIVTACGQINASQVQTAVSVLRQLCGVFPEAGTALGALAGRFTLPLSDDDRWSYLLGAFSAGDLNAQEYLNLMCKSAPDRYSQSPCSHCGAPVYRARNNPNTYPCHYCRGTERR